MKKVSILSGLPDDIWWLIFHDWLDRLVDVLAFDTAICTRDFRTQRLSECLNQVGYVPFAISTFESLKGLQLWQEKRQVCIHNLHMKITGNQQNSIPLSRLNWKAFRHLQALSIEFTNDKSDIKLDIYPILNEIPSLAKFTISNEYISEVSVICRGYRSLTIPHNLKELHFQYVIFPEEQCTKLLDWFAQACPTLQILTLNHCVHFTNHHFLQLLQHLPQLVAVDYTNDEYDEDDDADNEEEEESNSEDNMENEEEETVASAITLEEITLRQTFQPLSHLRRLRLNNSMSISMLVSVLKHCNGATLEYFVFPDCDLMHYNELQDQHSNVLSHLIHTWTALQYIELGDGIPQTLFHTLCVACGSTLRGITLRGERTVKDETLSIIAQFVPRLEALSLMDCIQITDVGIETLCDVGRSIQDRVSRLPLKNISIVNCPGISIAGYHLLLDTFGDTLTSIAFKSGAVDLSLFDRFLTCNDDNKENNTWQQVETLELWIAEELKDAVLFTSQTESTVKFRSWSKLLSLELGYCTIRIEHLQDILSHCPKLQLLRGYGVHFLDKRMDEDCCVAGKVNDNKATNKRKMVRRVITVQGMANIQLFAMEEDTGSR